MKYKKPIRVKIYESKEAAERDEGGVEVRFDPTLGEAAMACLLPLQPGEDELHRTIDMDKLRNYGLEGAHADFPDRLENLADLSKYEGFDESERDEAFKRAIEKMVILEEDPTDPQP